jgi:hypothetical protein
VWWKSTDVSEELNASVFRIQGSIQQAESKANACCCFFWLGFLYVTEDGSNAFFHYVSSFLLRHISNDDAIHVIIYVP